jgi:hypothetical protein
MDFSKVPPVLPSEVVEFADFSAAVPEASLLRILSRRTLSGPEASWGVGV